MSAEGARRRRFLGTVLLAALVVAPSLALADVDGGPPTAGVQDERAGLAKRAKEAAAKGNFLVVKQLLDEAERGGIDLGEQGVTLSAALEREQVALVARARAALAKGDLEAADATYESAQQLGADDEALTAALSSTPRALSSHFFTSTENGYLLGRDNKCMFAALATSNPAHFAYLFDEQREAEYEAVATNDFKLERFFIELDQAARSEAKRMEQWRRYYKKQRFYAPIDVKHVVYFGGGQFGIPLGRAFGSVSAGTRTYLGRVHQEVGAFVTVSREKTFKCIEDSDPGSLGCYFVLAKLPPAVQERLGEDPLARNVQMRWSWTGFGAPSKVKVEGTWFDRANTDGPFGDVEVMVKFSPIIETTALSPSDIVVEILEPDGQLLWKSR